MSWSSSFIRCLPIKQDILNISQIAVTLHGIRQPFFHLDLIATIQQMYCSVSSPISFWTVRERRTMILRKIFTYFVKLQGIKIFSVSFYATSRTHRSCLPETDPQNMERSDCADEILLGKIILNDGFGSLLLSWRNKALVSRTHRIGFDMTELFRKINEDLDDSMSWNTHPNCRVSFNVVPLHFCCHSF